MALHEQKNIPISGILAVFGFMLSMLSGCTDKCEVTHVYSFYEPQYLDYQEFRNAVKWVGSVPLEEPGKIYIKGTYLFINEKGKGIHVIDNSNRRSPQQVGFIKIPGNYDMAVNGNILYADSYIDLVAIKINPGSGIKLVNRVENIFPRQELAHYSMKRDTTRGIVTGWQKVKEKEMIAEECEEVRNNIIPGNGGFYYKGNALRFFSSASPESTADMGSGSGTGGSMARFTISEGHLYTVDDSNLRSFDISDPQSPEKINEMNVGWGIETIFPYRKKLFLGAKNGMHIYAINKPASPTHISTYRHITSCDPVVVSGDFAYVTLRDLTDCRGNVNQLEIVDISNIEQPRLHRTYTMASPHGLGIDGDRLFICEGEYGLKSFEVNNAQTSPSINLKGHLQDFHAYDVIPFDNTLLTIGEDGLYQFDYSGNQPFDLLSKIDVEPQNEE